MEQYFLHSQTNEEHRSIFIDGTQALNRIGWLYRLLIWKGGGGGAVLLLSRLGKSGPE